MTNLDSILKKHTLLTKLVIVKAMVFPVVMYGCESGTKKKAEWVLKDWCFQAVVLEKILESPLDFKEIQPVHPKGNKSWIFTAGRDWRQDEKGMIKDEIVEWYHWLNRHEFEQIPGDSRGQGSLVCCSPWSHKESDTTEWLNNNHMHYLSCCTFRTVRDSGFDIAIGNLKSPLISSGIETSLP